LVGHFALTTLERLGKLVRGGNANCDCLARVIEQGDLRRFIAVI